MTSPQQQFLQNQQSSTSPFGFGNLGPQPTSPFGTFLNQQQPTIPVSPTASLLSGITITGSPSQPQSIPQKPLQFPYHVASSSPPSNNTAASLYPSTEISEVAIERMRRWLSEMILAQLDKVIKEVDGKLTTEGLAHLTTRGSALTNPAVELLAVADINKGGLKMLSPNSIQATTTPQPTLQASSFFAPKPATTGFGGFFGTTQQPAINANVKPPTLGALLQSRPNDPIVRMRLLLEFYLAMPSASPTSPTAYPRDYILQRISKLSEGGTLSCFKWDGGGEFNGQSWNAAKFPTDAQLVMHLFVRFMDLQLQMAGVGGSLTPFADRYFVGEGGRIGGCFCRQEVLGRCLLPLTRIHFCITFFFGSDPSRSLQIREISRFPFPHYGLLLRGGIPLDVPEKRQNLFSTLASFVKKAEKDSAGWLELLYLGSPEVGLLRVVQG